MGISMDFSTISAFLSHFGALSHLSRAAAGTIITALWQGTVIAACLAVCVKLVPRITAAHRFGIWAAGFLAIAALPFLPLVLHLTAGNATQILASGLQSGPARPWLQFDMRWSLALTALWLTASLLRAVDLAVHTLRLRRLWKTAVPVVANQIETGASLPASLPSPLTIPGRREAQLCTTTLLERPGVIGFAAPRILIPDWLFARLTSAELDQIVLHETEHLRRGDDWTNLLQKIALVLFPLSPALLWTERRLCLEREMACDEGVIRRTHAPRAYAECLTSLAERGLERRAAAFSLSLGVWQRRPELVRRVQSILRRRQVLSPIAARSLMATLACSLLFGTAELARCPRMVEFLPSNAESAQTQASNQTQASTLPTEKYADAGDRVLSSTFQPRFQHVVARTSLRNQQARPILTDFKVTVPARSQAPALNPTRKRARTAARRSPAPRSLVASSPEFAYPAAREEMLKADLSGSQMGATAAPDATQDPNQEQAWIVLTAWEEVRTPDQQPDQAEDNPVSSETAQQNPGQPSGQITITRLILRVMPATSVPSLPSAVPVRAGWLVFQL